MTGVGDDSRGRLAGRPWFVVGLALALAATLSLVLADDIRYLRLGIVAALWAALVGAFLAVRYRKQASTTEEVVAQAQEVYELELEREIAARREYELEIESEMRGRADSEARTELDALRSEVLALRESLQSLFGGEVLLERVALTAQATRMRALREEGRLVESPSAGARVPAQLTAAPPMESADRPTELIERVRDKHSRGGRPMPGAPEPRRPERSADLPPRRVAKNEPARYRPSNAAASVSKAAAEARADRLVRPGEQTRVTPPPPPEPPRRAAAAFEVTQPAFNPPDRTRDPGDEPTKLSKALDADWTPSWENQPGQEAFSAQSGNSAPVTPEPQPAARPQRAETSRPRMEPARRFESSRPSMEPAKPPRRFESSRPAMRPATRSEVSRPKMEPVTPPEAARPRIQPVGRVDPTPPVTRIEPVQPVQPPVEQETPSRNNPTLPEEVRRRAQDGGAGGRRRKPEAPPETPAETSGGGRRRRAEGEPPAWQAPSGGQSTGSHAKPELVGESAGRRAKPDEPSGHRAVGEDTGSHVAGRSVSDLLAAHGATTDAIPRRRRRAED